MKNIIVVTGASSGMGKEFVLQISKKEKADEIWVIARRENRLLALKDEVDVPIRAISIDLSDMNAIKKYERMLEEEKPNIKILANCSGYGKINHYENEELETYLNMVDLNVKAVIAMINMSLPYMHKGAKIMNLVSDSAFQPLPYINVYASTKAFLLSYSRALNKELEYRGIHVLAVCPYWVQTEFFDRAEDTKKEKVVVNYGVVYKAPDVIRKAIKDLYGSKDVSVYGFVNNFQRIGSKILPHSLIMKIWMKYQKLNGTKEIR